MKKIIITMAVIFSMLVGSVFAGENDIIIPDNPIVITHTVTKIVMKNYIIRDGLIAVTLEWRTASEEVVKTDKDSMNITGTDYADVMEAASDPTKSIEDNFRIKLAAKIKQKLGV